MSGSLSCMRPAVSTKTTSILVSRAGVNQSNTQSQLHSLQRRTPSNSANLLLENFQAVYYSSLCEGWNLPRHSSSIFHIWSIYITKSDLFAEQNDKTSLEWAYQSWWPPWQCWPRPCHILSHRAAPSAHHCDPVGGGGHSTCECVCAVAQQPLHGMCRKQQWARGSHSQLARRSPTRSRGQPGSFSHDNAIEMNSLYQKVSERITVKNRPLSNLDYKL